MARARRLVRNRRKLAPRRQWQPELITVVSCVKSVAGTSVITFNNEILFRGVPAYTNDAGYPMLTATQTSRTSITISWDGPLDENNSIIIPAWDEAVRTIRGGYVAPGTFEVTV